MKPRKSPVEKTNPGDLFRVEYRPLKGISRTLNRESELIEEIESEGFQFVGVVTVTDVKLMGFIFRRV